MPERIGPSQPEQLENDPAPRLTELARTHTDTLEDEASWKALGVSKCLSDEDYPKGFKWSLYVGEFGGRKNIGIKIFGPNGAVYDIRECAATDQSLPLSTDQEKVSGTVWEEGKALREEEEKTKNIKKQKLQDQYDQITKERGFPSGKYILSVTFPTKDASPAKRKITYVDVSPLDTRDRVSQTIGGEISLFGIHNFGFRPGTKKAALVQAILTHPDGTEVRFEKYVDANGHIATEEESKKEG